MNSHEDTKSQRITKNLTPLSNNEEAVAKKIVDAAYTVHENLGPGLLEKIYETCFCHELKKRNLSFRRQVEFPIIYDGLVFQEGLRIDVIVEDLIICEIKSVEENHPIYQAQILSYLKIIKKRLGFLINFNVPILKKGIKRFVI
jgi:GxxExxY protein